MSPLTDFARTEHGQEPLMGAVPALGEHAEAIRAEVSE
jgi:hypothetical protein